jgi:hypothetical protein
MSENSVITIPIHESWSRWKCYITANFRHSDGGMRFRLSKDKTSERVRLSRPAQTGLVQRISELISASKTLARLDSPRKSGVHRNAAIVLHALQWLELHRSAATENQRFTMLQEVTREGCWAFRDRSKFLRSLSRMASLVLDACVGLDNLSQNRGYR